MSQKATNSTHDADRALRLRENKRRNRQRQKDYTAELRSKLQQLQSEGIKATQEVQLSARRVVEDNLRLKALLRFKGVDDHTINTWTPEGDISNNPTVKMESGIMTESNCHLATPEGSTSPCDETQQYAKTYSYTPSSTELNSQVSSCSSGLEKEFPNELAPCKLMSHLAENPGTDLTQIRVSDHQVVEDEADGVECSKAYMMLIQFAITEEKLDIISQALEGGCTKGSKGGCKVQNEVIWKAIDDVS